MHVRALESRIMGSVTEASRQYGLIESGDRILVALSGGKDSYVLLWALRRLAERVPFSVSLVGYHLDQGQPGHVTTALESFLVSTGVPYEIELQDTYSRVLEITAPGKIYCSACSRFRRAILYKAATRHGCNKVALGHHRDDLIETLLLNVFFAGQIKAMPPKLTSQKGTHQLIRPLCLAREEDLAALAEKHAYPILPCNLCGSLNTQRVMVKKLLHDLEQRSPHIKGNILHSLQNVVPSHLMDGALAPELLAEPGRPLRQVG